MLEEKERLKEEWTLFKEQKKNFERERRSFTEAAIRLGLEVRLQGCCSGRGWGEAAVGSGRGQGEAAGLLQWAGLGVRLQWAVGGVKVRLQA